MTKVLVFSPTIHFGGLDVMEASITRQTVKPKTWIIADAMYPIRDYSVLQDIFSRLEANAEEPVFINYCRTTGALAAGVRNLCANYNMAARWAVEYNFDLFISLQDYIWIPEDGIENFVRMHLTYPNAILTGITDISSDPWPVKVTNRRGSYTIFDEPYTDKPKIIGWEDPRYEELYDFEDRTRWAGIQPQHWEANWAAIPVSVFRDGVFWDEDYDNGYAYENMDFAQRAAEAGYPTVLDRMNKAISLPHKSYWPQELIDLERYSNRSRYEARWGT